MENETSKEAGGVGGVWLHAGVVGAAKQKIYERRRM
jgi:hypothetical protein